MIGKLLVEEKLQLIKRAQAGEKVSGLCREFGISRAFFYKIRSGYLKSGQDPASLESSSQKQSPNRVSPEKEQLILDLVRAHPQYSSRKIASVLPKDASGRPLVGNHGIQNVLLRYGLNTYRKRLAFAGGKRKEALEKLKLPPEARLALIRRVEAGEKVAAICREYGICRTLFYRLFKRYQTAREDKLAALADRPPIPSHFWHLTPGDIEKKVLETVSEYPQLSVHKIVAALPQVSGRPILSNKGVQNVLRRHHLSTYEQRLAYSRLAEKAWKPRLSISAIPQIPLHVWRMLYAPFATIPKLGWLFTRGQLLLLLILIIGFYFFKVTNYIITSPTGTAVGTFFASISLTFGLFFFLYSLKYYLSVLLVLRLAQSGATAPDSSKSTVHGSGLGKILSKLGIHLPQRQGVNPLLVDLEKIKLGFGEKPFVSIHVAVYNEKKVVERLIRACTTQDWVTKEPNEPKEPKVGETSGSSGSSVPSGSAAYELIIVDDSTDETTEIVKQTLISADFELISTTSGESKPTPGVSLGADNPRSSAEEAVELFVFSKQGSPTVKLLHRTSRSGFKGGALQVALENTDARTAYIMVVDADFVPYPDTIEQFVKTFQVLSPIEPINVDPSTSLRTESVKSASNQPNQRSRVAVVQGYQWHVLNKSQTWVTRGVRTEYAGSYVIERSGEEIYGGLKQIAGSVYAIRADILRQFGWGTSITEDFELTLRLYEAGYKVAFTPYIQMPAEAVSTIRRLVRQRMRWAEGASFNVRKMFSRLMASPHLTGAEKLEFAYLAPYYLQTFFFIVGTLSWFMAEAVLGSRLPFWTAALGWSLVFTNFLALPLMNIIGMFLEESDERDYVGILSFIALSYIVVPFQAYAAIKGFLEREEGPWFRTPKTGLVTDVFSRSGFNKFFGNIFGKPTGTMATWSNLPAGNFALEKAFNPLRADNFRIRPRHIRWVSNGLLGVIIAITVLMSLFAPLIPIAPQVHAQSPGKLVTVEDAAKNQGKLAPEEPEEITTPRAIHLPTATSENLEMIFHQEPRVRIKLGQKEVEITTLEIEGVGKANPKRSLILGSEVRYEEIAPNIDLVYKFKTGGFEEHFILKKRSEIRAIVQRVVLKEVQAVGTNGVYGFFDFENNEIFKLGDPFLQEEKNPQNKNGEIKMTLEKDIVDFTFKKTLEDEAASWLAAPERNFPVILDPSVVVSGNIVDADVDFGGQQQKLVYVSGAYYAFHNEGGRIAYRRCSSNCNNGSANWSDGADVNLADGADTDNEGPNTYLDGTTIWVAWFDNSDDNIVFQSINTASADAQGSSTCASGDLGNVAGGDYVNIAKGSNGDFFVEYSDDPDFLEVTNVDINCSLTETFTDVTSGTGATAADQIVFVADGNLVHVIWQEGNNSGTANDGLQYQNFDLSTSGWSAEGDIDIANFSTSFGATRASDGDIWVHTVDGTGATALWRCAATCGGTWSEQTAPFSSETNVVYATITYASTENDLVVSAIMDVSGVDTTDQANFKTTDETTILYSDKFSYGFGTGGLGHIASMKQVTNLADAGVVLRQGSNFEFATVPEKTLFLLATLPFLPEVLKRLRRRYD